MQLSVAVLAFAVSVNALVARQTSCCFELTANGGPGGPLGQISDGQNRLGPGLTPAKYCIKDGALTDEQGRGCIITDPTTQFQCDQGITPQTGFAIGDDGALTFNGSPHFWICEANDQGCWNVYTNAGHGEANCESITFTADSCKPEKPQPSSSAPPPPPPFSSSYVLPPPPPPSSSSAIPPPPPPASTSPAPPPPSSSSLPPYPSSSTVPPPPSSSSTSLTPTYVPPPLTSSAPSTSPTSVAPPAPSSSSSLLPPPPQSSSYVPPPPSSSSSVPPPPPTTSAIPPPTPSTSIAPPPPSSSESSPPPLPSSTSTAPPPPSSSESSPPPSTSTAPPPPSSSSAVPPPAPSSTTCPTNLSGPHEYPHLIIPVDSSHPNTALGRSYNGEITPTVSSIFNFDMPSSLAGATCSLVFLFPEQSQETTSSFNFSGSGQIDFAMLSGPASESTTYDNAPSVERDFGVFTVAPGNAYVIATASCMAGESVTFELKGVGDTNLDYFQDYNPAPMGLYVTQC